MTRLVFKLTILILLAMQSSAEELGSDLQDKLESGQNIVLKDCSIKDDLQLRNLNLSRDAEDRMVVNSSLNFENCEILGNISCGSAVFKKPLIFKYTKFSGRVNFAKSKFVDYCSFIGADFKKLAIFDSSNFTGGADFRKAQFENTASFKDSIFCRPTYFIGTKFFEDTNFRGGRSNGMMDFEDAEFIKGAIFSGAKFEKGINFQSAKFLDVSDFGDAVLNGDTRLIKSMFGNDADFHNTTFEGDARFESSKFQDVAKFSNSTFRKGAIFTGSEFEGPADFSSVLFSGIAKFDDVEFNKIVRFINANFSGNATFFGAYFDRDARFEGASFGSRLNLTDATFSQLALSWEAIKRHLIKDKGTTLSLINNYKSMGWIKDRNQCYYDYRDYRRMSSEWGTSKVLDSASWLYWGYGVRPFNALISIFIITIFFGLIYYGLVYFKFVKVIKKPGRADGEEARVNLESKDALAESNSTKSEKGISFKDALVFSARNLLLRSPGDIQIEGTYARYAMWIQKTIFGFFVLLFIVFLNQEVQSYFKPPT